VINEVALDRAVRRFPGVLEACRELPTPMAMHYVRDMRPGIIREYRHIMASAQDHARLVLRQALSRRSALAR
jgi:hypothetical protein